MSTLKRFIKYYKPHKLILTLDMIAAFLVAAIGMGYPIITRYMLNDLIPNYEENWKLIIICGASLLGIYIVRMLLRYFIQYYGHIMGVAMQAEMRSELFSKVEKLPYSYFDEHETGKIMSRMTNDLFEISELAHHGPENLFIAGFTIIGAFTYLIIINWILALICFTMVPILFVVSYFCRKKMRAAFKATRVAQASINSSIESSISGIRVTKAYTNEQKELDKFEVSNQEFVEARKGTLKPMAVFFSSSSFIIDVFNVVIIVAGGLFVAKNYIALGDFSAFIVSINLFINPVNQLINFMEQFESADSGFKRFLEIIDEKEEANEGTLTLNDVKGNIDFEHVNFEYETSKHPILSDVSFSIKQGEKIALVGPTGGGKTTICHLIPRFYNVVDGVITIDGVNTKDIELSNLRQNIGIIQQDVFLFGGTIRENILYGNGNASEDDIQNAIDKSNLREFVNTLPDGLNTQIGERGVKLSGGQKQRISIARAFVKNPSILILDEATSALDNSTEFLIQSALDELCKGRTTLVVAHRLSTIRNANRIFVISGGKIVEQGSHEELIDHEGIYKSLYELQFKDLDEVDTGYLTKQLKYK